MNDKQKIAELEKELRQAKEALAAMYQLRGGMEKPIEHPPTRVALRMAEQVMWGYTMTP